jgi:hypothetical protein
MPRQQHPNVVADAIREFGDGINQEIARYNALPPLKKNLFRAGGGAGLIAFCLYIAFELHACGGVTVEWRLGYCGSSSASRARAGRAT